VFFVLLPEAEAPVLVSVLPGLRISAMTPYCRPLAATASKPG
jgi:hypothetical protein